MYRIGVLSDTHGTLRQEVKDILKTCDAIIHGGDIDKESVLTELKELASLYAVRGNADKDWAAGLPKTLSVTIHGLSFYIVHNKKDMEESSREADIVVYGHSHKYEERPVNNQIWLNPGSCGRRRFSLPVTMAVIEINEKGRYQILRKDIQAEPPVSPGAVGTNMAKIVKAVMKDMDKGIPVKEIAARQKISPELAEQICRMYATHPGVDVDGILNRIS